MPSKRIILLANSRKHLEQCLAGKEELPHFSGEWVRPVSHRESRGLIFSEMRYGATNTAPQLLDVLDLALDSAIPDSCQSENWLLDTKYYWVKQRAASWDEAHAYVDNEPALWVNGFSSYDGHNNEIPESHFALLHDSLRLIHVADFRVHAFFSYNKRKLYGIFEYNGVNYKLSLTDTLMESRYKTGPLGWASLGECLICLSVSEPFNLNGKRYKLIAGVMPQNLNLPILS